MKAVIPFLTCTHNSKANARATVTTVRAAPPTINAIHAAIAKTAAPFLDRKSNVLSYIGFVCWCCTYYIDPIGASMVGCLSIANLILILLLK